MKLLRASVQNFGSYKDLSFDFSQAELNLVYGATGSGKSTLQDIPVWILFGITSKDGTADEIKSWTSPNEPTVGTLEIETQEGLLKITRIRGKPSQNDLYWEQEGTKYRGKDASETQTLLNSKINVDSYLYLLAACYNEFSAGGSFFTAKASDRRELLENLADLSMPTLLTERIAIAKKDTRKTFTEILERYNKTDGKLEQLKRSEASSKRDAESWSRNQERTVKELEVKSQKFNEEKESKIQVVILKAERFEIDRKNTILKYGKDLERKTEKFKFDKVCRTCGDVRDEDANDLIELHEDYSNLIKKEENLQNPYVMEKTNLESQDNFYLAQLEVEKSKINPFDAQKASVLSDITVVENQKISLKADLDASNKRKVSLDQLSKLTEELRSQLLVYKIKSIEESTNRYLETYFDSEIKVVFETEEADKLSVLIWKSGHECSYKQLSKGQRGLLKLCFSISIMQAASNKAGIHFDTLMFDEALDGLDNNLKLKAFNLFNELNIDHSSIFVIDHSEGLQSLFSRKYYVTMEEDISTIEEQ